MSTCASATGLTTHEIATHGTCRRRPWQRVEPERLRRLVVSLLLAMATILVSTGTARADEYRPPRQRCDAGVFCAWNTTEYRGDPYRFDLRGTNMEECVPLGDGFEVRSFVNRIDRPVTVYQDAHCSTVGDFSTYPGGTYVPKAPYVVRAIQIWTH